MALAIEEKPASATQVMQGVAAAQAEEPTRRLRRDGEAAAKRALIEQLQRSSGVSDEEAIRHTIKLIDWAFSNRQIAIQVYRFPHQLCSDGGRAIREQAPGWETTLTGVSWEIFRLWNRYLRPCGYELSAEIISFKDGMPADVGMTLRWA